MYSGSLTKFLNVLGVSNVPVGSKSAAPQEFVQNPDSNDAANLLRELARRLGRVSQLSAAMSRRLLKFSGGSVDISYVDAYP